MVMVEEAWCGGAARKQIDENGLGSSGRPRDGTQALIIIDGNHAEVHIGAPSTLSRLAAPQTARAGRRNQCRRRAVATAEGEHMSSSARAPRAFGGPNRCSGGANRAALEQRRT